VNEHVVHTYQDSAQLAAVAGEYLLTGLQRGEAAIVIARPEHAALLQQKLQRFSAQLTVFDAHQTLGRCMSGGMPQWQAFHELVGGVIAQLRLQHAHVRAYGEMVDILWQEGNTAAALRLEEYWNELGRLQTFSLFCAYALDHLDVRAYAGLHSICKTHTHFIPARDGESFDRAVREATCKVLDGPLAELLLSLAERHRAGTRMPQGQATLFWLAQNMPRTADKVLQELRSSPAGR
jgi:hypothetical protein